MSFHMVVYPHLQVQEASSGSSSVESMRSALADPLLTHNELITCQSSGADHLDLPLSSDGDDDEDISDEDFWVSLVS